MAETTSSMRHRVLRVADFLLSPLFALAARFIYLARKFTFRDMPRSAIAIQRAGIYPLINHYYEPLIEVEEIRERLDEVRPLPGLKFDVPAHLATLAEMEHCRDFVDIVGNDDLLPGYVLDNGTFESGDAEVLFGVVRHYKPKRIIEVGCGNSTRVIQAALKLNSRENGAESEHLCVEPFEAPWLEDFGVTLIRKRVEDCDMDLFRALEEGDILFIDSSHMIRPVGDVLFLIQTVLGVLRPGVIVHVHDIFSPRNYPARLIIDHRVFWNEQYLLEAYMADNPNFEILVPLNHLWHEDRAAFSELCPGLKKVPHDPASFWIRKIQPQGAPVI